MADTTATFFMLLKSSGIIFWKNTQNLRFVLGRDSSVGTATSYRLDGPEIESRWGRNILHPSRQALGPTQPPVQWVSGLSI
jgi:hypothetical protein